MGDCPAFVNKDELRTAFETLEDAVMHYSDGPCDDAIDALAIVEAEFGRLVASTMSEDIFVVFDGPPGHESGRFIDVENARGQSVNAGEWSQRDDRMWQLHICISREMSKLQAENERLYIEVAEFRGKATRYDAGLTACDELAADFNAATAQISDLQDENEQLKAWVADLQAGSYINCVYCGHRYGPNCDTPASMADVLKEHV